MSFVHNLDTVDRRAPPQGISVRRMTVCRLPGTIIQTCESGKMNVVPDGICRKRGGVCCQQQQSAASLPLFPVFMGGDP